MSKTSFPDLKNKTPDPFFLLDFSWEISQVIEYNSYVVELSGIFLKNWYSA